MQARVIPRAREQTASALVQISDASVNEDTGAFGRVIKVRRDEEGLVRRAQLEPDPAHALPTERDRLVELGEDAPPTPSLVDLEPKSRED